MAETVGAVHTHTHAHTDIFLFKVKIHLLNREQESRENLFCL